MTYILTFCCTYENFITKYYSNFPDAQEMEHLPHIGPSPSREFLSGTVKLSLFKNTLNRISNTDTVKEEHISCSSDKDTKGSTVLEPNDINEVPAVSKDSQDRKEMHGAVGNDVTVEPRMLNTTSQDRNDSYHTTGNNLTEAQDVFNASVEDTKESNHRQGTDLTESGDFLNASSQDTNNSDRAKGTGVNQVGDVLHTSGQERN